MRALEFRTPAKGKIINVLIWGLSSAIGVPLMVMAVTKTTDSGEKVTSFNGFLVYYPIK